ncbi:MAG: trigger factor [Planctomycetota bacterium]
MADDQSVIDAPETDAEETKLEQTVTVEDSGPAKKTLTIEVPESRIQDKIEDSYQTLSDEAAVPGFRRGRAPRRLLERRFASSVRDDVKGQILSESYTQAVEEHELDVLGEPEVKDIEDLELPESGPLTFTVEVEVTPDVTLPDFSELKIDKPSAEVSDDDVADELTSLQQRNGKTAKVESAIEADDYVQADAVVLAGEDAGEDAEVLQEGNGVYILVAGESRDYKGHVLGILVPDLGKTLTGKTTGETVTVSMTGPQSHENEKIREQPITIKLSLTAVERVEPAPLEELLPQMGMETEDELKERVRTYLEQRAEQNQTAEMHRQVREQLTEKVELELPEGVTGRQVERSLARTRMEMLYRGVPESEVEQLIAEQRDQNAESAKQQLKEFFILDKASKDLEIEVDENEINGRIAMLAMQQGRRPEKLRQEMVQQGQIEQLYLQLREQKTMDKVLESATVTDAAPAADSEDKPKKTTKKKTTKKKTTKKKED